MACWSNPTQYTRPGNDAAGGQQIGPSRDPESRVSASTPLPPSCSPLRSTTTESGQVLLGWMLAVGYCSLLGGLSTLPGWGFLLFPELGPLAATVLSRPNGRWASSPWQLVGVPTAAAVCGLWVSNHVAIESLALLLAVLMARLLLSLLRSSLAPALSAAALPVILGIHSWAYPVQIAIGLIGLNAVLAVRHPSVPQVMTLVGHHG